jgi:MtN3 and saliva related transmembrane protein
MIEYLGYFAGSLTVFSFLPQVYRSWQTRRTGDLSMSMFALLITASSLWMIYGALNRDWPVILTNGGMVALNLALAVAKVRFSEGDACVAPRSVEEPERLEHGRDLRARLR